MTEASISGLDRRQWLARTVRSIARWFEAQSTLQALRSLDDTTLKDIGLTKGDIHRAAAETSRKIRD